MIDYSEVEPAMRGRWPDFISDICAIDVDLRGDKSKPRPCPQCGGDDRAHFRESDGRLFLFCRGACGDRSSQYGSNTCTTPEDLVRNITGWSFGDLVYELAQWLGLDVDAPNGRSHGDSGGEIGGPLGDLLTHSEVKPWHRIPHLARNNCAGPGEHLAIGDDLLVPLYVDSAGRAIMTGAVQVREDGKIKRHGSCRGAYATFETGPGGYTVFATNAADSLVLGAKLKSKCYYSPDPKAGKLTGARLVFVNSNYWESIDKACGVYGPSVDYIIPKYGADTLTRTHQYIRKTYAQIQDWVASKEDQL